MPSSLSSSRPNGNTRLEPYVAVRAWTYGWAVSRSTGTPTERKGYYKVVVGKPEQTERYVIPRFDRELIQQIVHTEATVGSWLKICSSTDKVRDILPSNWSIHAPELLMNVDLSSSDRTAIAGYISRTNRVGQIVHSELITATGEVAASGQVAVVGPFATFDKIVTAQAHRRRGLGGQIMDTLSHVALQAGAHAGVLVATEDGVALYTALGWSVVSPITAAASMPPSQ